LASFELLGLVRPEAVPYAQARVLVSTSLSEGSSNSILEALAHGTPVVATAVGAASEALEGQPFATLVKPQDPASVSAAIDYWLKLSRSEWEAASTSARKYVRDHFSVSKMAARHCAFYRWAIGVANSSTRTPGSS
jgi:glycosyltransferase involved in cell wall biosynthesis